MPKYMDNCVLGLFEFIMTDEKCKMLKLTAQERRVYEQECLGQCTTCMLDGACELQNKLKKED